MSWAYGKSFVSSSPRFDDQLPEVCFRFAFGRVSDPSCLVVIFSFVNVEPEVLHLWLMHRNGETAL